MAPADFLQNLLKLLIWEDYDFTTQEQPALFASLTSAEAALYESSLRKQWQELRELALLYQSEKTLSLLGLLCTQQGHLSNLWHWPG